MFKVFPVTAEMKDNLKRQLESQEEAFKLRDIPLLGGLMTSLGIAQEVGSVNDELQRHLFDGETGQLLKLEDLHAEVITWRGKFGVRIWSSASQGIMIDHPTLEHLLHPEFSYNEMGEVHQLVFFPEIIASISYLERVDPVIVKKWALNTIFGGFDPTKNFYVTNHWEIMQNDGLRMAGLLKNRQIPFMGTHDLCAHVSGVDKKSYDLLSMVAGKHLSVLSTGDQSSYNHLFVPYLMGMLIDDLAQPRNYGCPFRIKVLDELAALQMWVVKYLEPAQELSKFPDAFGEIIEETRVEQPSIANIKALTSKLAMELREFGRHKRLA